MSYLFLICIGAIVILCAYVQYLWAKQRKRYLFLLPLLFILLTFIFCFISLLFALVLIFIAQLASKEPIRPSHKHGGC